MIDDCKISYRVENWWIICEIYDRLNGGVVFGITPPNKLHRFSN